MALLRISDVPLGGGQRRVEVSWQDDGAARQSAVSSFAYKADGQDAEKVRWYLEDYAEFPADPAPMLAAGAERVLAQTGTGLFSRVFAGLDAAGIWAQALARLGDVRVEVDSDPAEAPGLPWELLRDPGSDAALATGAGEFVRTHLQTAGRVRLPETAGDELRVLLVICRPGGGEDVPFRSVASRLVRGGAVQMEGLRPEVLRPATFARLSKVLHEAADAGRPYHVVHFDGHGTYLDLATLLDDEGGGQAATALGGGGEIGVSPLRYGISVAGPVREGPHGYLVFEDPGSGTNQQLVDGPALGRLLTATGVPVLVLNACRSAWTEASARPGEPEQLPAAIGAGPVRDSAGAAADDGGLADVHARIRAYGSLAAEVADAGVPGVVAMRYNVYVVTAAQYVADLYAHLLSGKTLGRAATAARRALADNPTREIGAIPVALQDWAVPVVYEAAPLALLEPERRQAPLIRLTPADRPSGAAEAGVPRPPDAGFFGRDETLLALDRAFDTQQVVLLHAFAGAGKTTTAAEFARWYAATGGLHHPQLGDGPVLWSSFEHHLPLDRLLDSAGDAFASLLEANGIHWQAVTDPEVRRNLVLQILGQVPTLWVWDNTEPVTGFPPGTQSAWTQEEQDQVAAFLRDLAQQTRCKVLLTSRRDEQDWLGALPARLRLPPMPMRERVQLAQALAVRHPGHDPGTDWRPLLRYAAGNPLTITVLVGQALREGLTSAEDLEGFVERIRAGETSLEGSEDAALGRARSLAASLSYGFAHAFTETERAQLAALHLFRDAIGTSALRLMGDPDVAGDDVVPQLTGLTSDTVAVLLDRAAAIGLLSPLNAGYYQIHPALPWYFTTLYAAAYGPPGSPGTARAYTHAIARLGRFYYGQHGTDAVDTVPVLTFEEGNLLHALTLALSAGHWADAVGCLQGLCLLYTRTGRDGEWARLVAQVTPTFMDPDTDGPIPGREDSWHVIASYQAQIAMNERNWPAATRLQDLIIARSRERAVDALATPADELTPVQRNRIRNLAVSLEYLGHILQRQGTPDCLRYYGETLELFRRVGARVEEGNVALTLGNAYKDIPGPRDLDQAEHWYRHSLSLAPEHARLSRAKALWALGMLAQERLYDALTAGRTAGADEHISKAVTYYHQALDLIPADDAEDLAGIHNQLGNIYTVARDSRQALHHYQQAIKHHEARGDPYGAGLTRYNVAVLLQAHGRPRDALLYARAALHDYQRIGPGAAEKVAKSQNLITQLEAR